MSCTGVTLPAPMPCHVRVRPVRVHYWDSTLRVHAARVIGWRAVCSCEWRGPIRKTRDEARGDAHAHGAAVSGATGGA